jgi:radical SAM protein with 4Fe4S-binding SPASM domain
MGQWFQKLQKERTEFLRWLKIQELSPTATLIYANNNFSSETREKWMDNFRKKAERQIKKYISNGYKVSKDLKTVEDGFNETLQTHRRTLMLNIKTTTRCNLKCPHCYDQLNIVRDMDIETLKATIDKLGHVTKSIVWFGGEPMLRGKEWMTEAVAYVKRKHPEIGMNWQTNLSLLDDWWLNFSIDNSIAVGTSFEGTINNYVRGHTKLFLKNYNKVKMSGHMISAIQVYNDMNMNQLIQEYEYNKHLGIRAKINMVFAVQNLDFDHNPYKYDSIEQARQAANKKIKLFDYWIHDVETPSNKPYDIGRVGYYLDSLVGEGFHNCTSSGKCIEYGIWGIEPNGDINQCTREIYLPFANVHDINVYEDVKTTPRWKEMLGWMDKTLNDPTKCGSCTLKTACRGGCSSENQKFMNADGTDFIVDPFRCEMYKELYSWLYFKIRDIDLNDPYLDKKYNPLFIKMLKQKNYTPMHLIKKYEAEVEELKKQEMSLQQGISLKELPENQGRIFAELPK